jgi:hypothetical protein
VRVRVIKREWRWEGERGGGHGVGGWERGGGGEGRGFYV